MIGYLLAVAFLFTFSENAYAQQPAPLYLTLKGPPKNFTLFATSGFDGNWYVGYNSMWIAALTVPEQGVFERAFLGAKLGRMKTKKLCHCLRPFHRCRLHAFLALFGEFLFD